jgi:hypothetical protein
MEHFKTWLTVYKSELSFYSNISIAPDEVIIDLLNLIEA